MNDVAQRLADLKRDKSIGKRLRTRLEWLRFADEPTPLAVLDALCTLREGAPVMPRALAEFEAMLTDLARMSGHNPGTTAEEADREAERLRLGCWIVARPAPDVAIAVLGGLPWEKILASIEAKRAKALADSDNDFLFGAGLDTSWSYYLRTLDNDGVRARVQKVRTVCERAGFIGEAAPDASWCNGNHFAFSDGESLGFSWRAWGDLQIAITGNGDYLDWYG